MITITSDFNNTSLYLFDDSAGIVSTPENITCPDFIIGDLNSDIATVHTDVTPPSDWQSNRYTFDGSTWSAIEGWVDPRLAEIASLQARIDTLTP